MFALVLMIKIDEQQGLRKNQERVSLIYKWC